LTKEHLAFPNFKISKTHQTQPLEHQQSFVLLSTQQNFRPTNGTNFRLFVRKNPKREEQVPRIKA
jgi:hypothetical protein